MSGKALAAGIAANQTDQEPAASALPLTYFTNEAKVAGSPATDFNGFPPVTEPPNRNKTGGMIAASLDARHGKCVSAGRVGLQTHSTGA